MHRSRKLKNHIWQGGAGKAIVMRMLERGGTVRAEVINDRTLNTVQPIVRENVEPGSQVHSDEWAGNWRMDEDFEHKVIDRLEAYVSGNIHTNGMENFWSLLKRSLHGTCVSVEPFHLFRYVDEQAFRYNNRNMDDVQRFVFAMRHIIGRRLTYEQLTGKVGDACHG